MKTLSRYPEYKTSEVGWLGDVPAHWEIWPVKYVAQFINGAAFKPTDWGSEGVPIIRIENLNGGDEFNRTTLAAPPKCHVQKGDILFGWSGNRGTSFGPFIWEREGRYYLNQHIFRLEDFNCHRRWLYWMLKAVTLYVEQQAHGIIGMVHITKGDLGVIKVPMPPKTEQQATAEFLDRETARIDGLVAKKERLIALLQEKRTALISLAVTKGLNPDAPMKHSGVEWLGSMPEHWCVLKVKFIAARGRGNFTDGDWIESPFITRSGVRLLQCGNVGTGIFEEQGFRYISEETFGHLQCSEVFPNEVLICRLRSSPRILAGRACLAPNLGYRMITSVDNCILRPGTGHDPRFIVYQMSLPAYLGYVEQIARGGTRDRISRAMLADFKFAVPPEHEQRAIADSLDRETAKLDALITKTQSSIERLQEYRTALISATVTGKIDVRGQTV